MNLDIDMKDIAEVIVFDTEINSAVIGSYLTGIQRIISQTPDAKIVIYFSSSGGSLTHADLLLNYLNSLQNNIILFAFNQISSAAFKVILSFVVKKILWIIHIVLSIKDLRIFM